MIRRIPFLVGSICVAAVLGGCALIPMAGSISNDQATAAADSAAKADVLNAKVAFLTYTIENNAIFPDSIEILYDNGYTPTGNTEEVTFVTYSDISFCIQAVSASGTTFSSTDEASVVEGSCD